MKYTIIIMALALTACGTTANNSAVELHDDAFTTSTDGSASQDAGKDAGASADTAQADATLGTAEPDAGGPGTDAGAEPAPDAAAPGTDAQIAADVPSGADAQVAADTQGADTAAADAVAVAPDAGPTDAGSTAPDTAAQPKTCSVAQDCPGAADLCVGGTCVAAIACTANNACTTAGLVCDKVAGHCVQCVTAANCASGNVCQSGKCTAPPLVCASAADCVVGKVCDLSSGACVQCVQNTDCATGHVCTAAACVAAPLPTPTPAPTPTPTPSASTIPLSAASWVTEYDGYGSVTYDATNGIYLSPMASTQPSETHAALALAAIPPMKDFHLVITASTDQQLRTGSTPNTWETFWIFFNYQPTATGKNTNYFTLKTNGVELGTATDLLGQTFLDTGSSTATAVGASNTFDIVKVGTHVKVMINGTTVVDYTGTLFDVAGSIGLYTEDARVHVTSVSVSGV